MKDPGYTLSDLEGELWARGIDIDEIENLHLECQTPESAARAIEADRYGNLS